MIKITNEEFKFIKDLIYKHAGIHLKDCKKNMINSRFQKILAHNKMNSFSEYFDYILRDKNSEEFHEFLHRITTHHTFFHREEKHYVFLEKYIFPWIHSVAKDYDIRIWSAGCSTGEEPYTLAFYLDDFFKKRIWRKEILATDISIEALKKASIGIYKKKTLSQLPNKWLNKYFILKGSKYEVIPRIKKEIVFRKFNLMDPFPFKKRFHVIFCRNVMIYFNNEVREKLITKYENYLLPGGYLIIGVTESITNLDGHKLQIVSPSIYRKMR